MADKSLAGKKIAVLVESQYIPAEIKCYQERFAGYGAEVHLMSRLWGQPKQTFVSEVEVAGTKPETLEVVDRFHAGQARRLRGGDHGRQLHERAASLERSGGDQRQPGEMRRGGRPPSTFSAPRCRTGGSSRARRAMRCGC